jgi:hypothetical protein
LGIAGVPPAYLAASGAAIRRCNPVASAALATSAFARTAQNKTNNHFIWEEPGEVKAAA